MKNKNVLFLILTVMLNVLSAGAFAQKNDSTIVIQTSGHCGDCKETIEKALAFTKGVKKADFEAETGKVIVVYNATKTGPEKLRTAISKAGYDADSLQADPDAYNRLKACCKKDGKELMR